MYHCRSRIALSPDEERELEQLAESPARSPRARRARIVLLLARGQTTGEICTEVGCCARTVKAWRMRYLSEGLASLRGSRRRR
jgi:DNA-binding NarL/FixJ family response regulator